MPKPRAPFADDVRVWRAPAGRRVRTNIRWSVVWHSPDGFELGYEGSGPADLALNILNAFVPPGRALHADEFAREDEPVRCFRGYASRFACRWHQEFKREFIATMPPEGAVIPRGTIEDWIAVKRQAGPPYGSAELA